MNPSPNQPRNRARPAGFTLVEMITVVIIVAIAAALAVPMMSNTADTRLRGAASVLAADLAFAQVESVAHSDDPRLVVFDNPNDAYHLAVTSDPATPITNPIAKQPYLVTFGQGNTASLTNVTIDSYTLNGDDQLGFGIYGGLDQPTDATITLGCEGMTVTLTADANTGETIIGAIN